MPNEIHRDALIATTDCPKCGAVKGERCIGKRKPERRQCCSERWQVADSRAMKGLLDKAFLSFDCPKCGAVAGADCVNMADAGGVLLHPHKERNPESPARKRWEERKRYDEWRAANRQASGLSPWATITAEEARRDAYYRETYGISLSDYNRMLSEQGGRCRLCKGPPGPEHDRLVVDHCHVTGKVRGLLCDTCNHHVLGIVVQDSKGLVHALKQLDVLRDYVVAAYAR